MFSGSAKQGSFFILPSQKPNMKMGTEIDSYITRDLQMTWKTEYVLLIQERLFGPVIKAMLAVHWRLQVGRQTRVYYIWGVLVYFDEANIRWPHSTLSRACAWVLHNLGGANSPPNQSAEDQWVVSSLLLKLIPAPHCLLSMLDLECFLGLCVFAWQGKQARFIL